jgi:hypothetical protein
LVCMGEAPFLELPAQTKAVAAEDAWLTAVTELG